MPTCYVILTSCPAQEGRSYIVCVDKRKVLIEKGIDTAVEVEVEKMPDNKEAIAKILRDVSRGIGKLVKGEIIEIDLK